MKKIKYPKLYKNSKSRSGSFGTYIRFSKTKGIKILDSGTPLHRVKKEIKNIQYAFEKGVGPKFYSLVRIVKKIAGIIEGKEYGIIMEHLNGKHKSHVDACQIEKELREKGIYFRDAHNENVMFFKNGTYKICDFTPGFFRILRKRY